MTRTEKKQKTKNLIVPLPVHCHCTNIIEYPTLRLPFILLQVKYSHRCVLKLVFERWISQHFRQPFQEFPRISESLRLLYLPQRLSESNLSSHYCQNSNGETLPCSSFWRRFQRSDWEEGEPESGSDFIYPLLAVFRLNAVPHWPFLSEYDTLLMCMTIFIATEKKWNVNYISREKWCYFTFSSW